MEPIPRYLLEGLVEPWYASLTDPAKAQDHVLEELVKVDPTGKSTEEKMRLLRQHRMDQYNKAVDAAYEKRGWDKNGVPTPARLKQLGIDLPQVMKLYENRK